MCVAFYFTNAVIGNWNTDTWSLGNSDYSGCTGSHSME